MEHAFLTDILLLLLVSIPVVVLLRRLRLPPLAGFLVVGALLGPHALGWIQAREEVEGLAEIGVALLLFTVGLEFSVPRVLLLKRMLVLGGGGQILATIVLATAAGLALGLEVREALFVSFLASLSSTALALKLLSDERQVDAPHGQVSVAILLCQDLSIIPLLLLVPVVAGGEGGGFGGLVLAVGKALLGVGAVLLIARYGFSSMAHIVVRAGGRELFTLFTVLVALGAAWITQELGLPLALGAFVAGLVVSESEYSHQVVDEILPFRDVFSALFFVSVGMLLDASILVREPWIVLGCVVALIVLKGGVIAGLTLGLTRSPRSALLAAAALFQIGEFSFVIARQGASLGVLSELHEQRFLAAAVVTMLMTPFMLQGAEHLATRIFPGDRPGEREDHHGLPPVQVLIAGYGLTGQHLARVLEATGVPYRVLEMNPDTVRRAVARGEEAIQADVSRSDALLHAGLREAKVLVVAINDPSAARRAVALARKLCPGVQILVRTRFLKDVEELLRLGASQVVPEEFETSVEIFGRVLRELHVPRGTIAVQTELVRREGYQILRSPHSEAHNLGVVGEILASTAVDTLFVSASTPACGRTLGELGVRAGTGATVLSAVREGSELHGPGADFRLQPNDLLVVMGDHGQLDSVRRMIEGGAPASA